MVRDDRRAGAMTDAGGHRHGFDPASTWADGIITPVEGLEFVADLGFELVHGDRPDRPGGANLVVAFRERPTEHHFDPEVASYWAAEHGRGVKRDLDRSTTLPDPGFAWGRIVLTDRLGVVNTFLTFGGVVRLADTDHSTRVAVFGSPAPIERWGGHSQEHGVRADEVGAFFGRLRAAIGSGPAMEARVSAIAPLTLYAALICDVRGRLDEHPTLADARPGLVGWSREEHASLESTAPGALTEARALLAALALDVAG
jgi:hypothetical protein